MTACLALVALGPASASSTSSTSSTPVLVQQCDGSRAPVQTVPTCTRWKVEWANGNKLWGMHQADDRKTIEAHRNQTSAFGRRAAQLQGKEIDPRLASPSALICDVCAPKTNLGRWGKGQTFSGVAAYGEIGQTRTKLGELRTRVFETDVPVLADAVRLTKFKSTKKPATRYVAAIEASVAAVAASGLALDTAESLLVGGDVDAIGKQIDAAKTELETSRAALEQAVAKTVASAHGGTYEQDGASTPAQLIVAFDGAKVTATYSVGGSTSQWFEGTVSLDGSVTGRSLMAPEGGKLSCKDHSEKCGYEYISSVLRFASTPGSKTERAELWFQRKKWVQAPLFTRTK